MCTRNDEQQPQHNKNKSQSCKSDERLSWLNSTNVEIQIKFSKSSIFSCPRVSSVKESAHYFNALLGSFSVSISPKINKLWWRYGPGSVSCIIDGVSILNWNKNPMMPFSSFVSPLPLWPFIRTKIRKISLNLISHHLILCWGVFLFATDCSGATILRQKTTACRLLFSG